MVSVGEVESEVIVEGNRPSAARSPEVAKEEMREVVREVVEEMLERYLRLEERRG